MKPILGLNLMNMFFPLDNEPIIKKKCKNSAFIGTDLKREIRQGRNKYSIITGITTNHCVSTTTRMAGNYGYETYIISDATAAFDRTGNQW